MDQHYKALFLCLSLFFSLFLCFVLFCLLFHLFNSWLAWKMLTIIAEIYGAGKNFLKMLTFWRFSIKFYQFTTFYHFLFQKLIFPYLPAVSIGATGEKIWSLEHFLSRFFCYIVLLLITKFIVFSWYNH